MNQNTLAEFHAHYHSAVLKNPDLYRTNDEVITVVLPTALLEYANAAAGHSGFGSGARAVGIRRKTRNSEQALAQIFATPESLQAFIAESECDGPAMIEQIQRKHAERLKPKITMTADPEGFWSKYTKTDMEQIKARTRDHKQLVQDFKTLSLEQFETRYILVDTSAA